MSTEVQAPGKKSKTKEMSVPPAPPPTTIAVQGRTAAAFEGDPADILIPRILLAQKTSKIMEAGGVKLGQIFRSTTSEILGGLGEPVPIIPLKQWKTWTVTEKGGKFHSSIPCTEENKHLPWEFTEAGKTLKREQTLNFYVLIPTDIEKNLGARRSFAETGELPEGDLSLFPCHLNFKSTSFRAGKLLVSHFATMSEMGAQPYALYLNLDSEVTKNDSGSFAVYTVARGGRNTNPEYVAVCKRWLDIMGQTSLKVDEAIPEHDQAPPANSEAFC